MPSKKLTSQRPRDGCIVAGFPENENEIASRRDYAILPLAKN
jgi:hypothetical protein